MSPLPKNSKGLENKDLQQQQSGAYTPAYKENPKTAQNQLKDLPAELAEIVTAWPNLPEHIKQTIITLLRSV